jgi:hypothetical protein
MRHGIDFKTHSQCQRRGQIPLARPQVSPGPDLVFSSLELFDGLVEPIGIEPMTSSLQS